MKKTKLKTIEDTKAEIRVRIMQHVKNARLYLSQLKEAQPQERAELLDKVEDEMILKHKAMEELFGVPVPRTEEQE